MLSIKELHIWDPITFLLTFTQCTQWAQWWQRQLYCYDTICPVSSPTQKLHGTHLLLFETVWNCKHSSTSLQIQISISHDWCPKLSRQGLTSVFYREHLAFWQNIHLFHIPEYTFSQQIIRARVSCRRATFSLQTAKIAQTQHNNPFAFLYLFFQIHK